MHWVFLIGLLSLMLSGCAATASLMPPRHTDAAVQSCLALYHALDAWRAQREPRVTAWARIEGVPYLRVDRFLASWRHEPLTPEQSAAWLERMRRLDWHARRIELSGWSAAERQALRQRLALAQPLAPALAHCGRLLVRQDLQHRERLAWLRQAVQVAADYRTSWRVLGLYPVTQVPFAVGVWRYQQATYRVFEQPLMGLRVHGRLVRYGPARREALSASDIAALLARSADNSLRMPEPEPVPLERLFASHAPIWEIDTVGYHDRPGTPYWQGARQPTVDPQRPVVYRYVSYARWHARPLLQLNYVIWFAARPPVNGLDIYAGRLDGITWRVTLAPDGRPLMYDAMHNCGCYHMFFPRPGLRLQTRLFDQPEPPLIPQYGPLPEPGERLVIRLASRTHYLQRLYTERAGRYQQRYPLRAYDELYRVTAPNGSARSLFGADTLVAGTQRPERWLFWPMGIASPGAMRERGHHATLFIGRRHFDDPHLPTELFRSAPYLGLP